MYCQYKIYTGFSIRSTKKNVNYSISYFLCWLHVEKYFRYIELHRIYSLQLLVSFWFLKMWVQESLKLQMCLIFDFYWIAVPWTLAVRWKGQWYLRSYLASFLWTEVTLAHCTHGLVFVFTISPQLSQNIKLLFISNLSNIVL